MANPGIDLRLHAADEPVDFRSGAVDVAIRYGRGHKGTGGFKFDSDGTGDGPECLAPLF